MLTQNDKQGIGMTSQRTRQRLVSRLKEQGISSHVVLDVIQNTPRHLFMDEALAHRAYEDTALPIGHHQTISRPYTVARMTELILANKPKSVFEVGMGSGYQTAILAQLVAEVVTVERIKPLFDKAKLKLNALKYRNIRFHYADAMAIKNMQFDAVLAAAAPTVIPESFINLLNVGGRLVMPEACGDHQVLIVIDKTESGIEKKVIEQARFVPLMPGKS